MKAVQATIYGHGEVHSLTFIIDNHQLLVYDCNAGGSALSIQPACHANVLTINRTSLMPKPLLHTFKSSNLTQQVFPIRTILVVAYAMFSGFSKMGWHCIGHALCLALNCDSWQLCCQASTDAGQQPCMAYAYFSSAKIMQLLFLQSLVPKK